MTSKPATRRQAAVDRNNPLAQGMALHKAGDLDSAERHYRQINRRDRHYGDALRLRGLLARQRGDVATAVKLLRRAIEQQRTNAVFHHTLAEVLRADGQLDAAVASYRRAWTLQPARDATGVDLAETLAQGGRVDEAIETWRQLLPRDPGRASARIATLYHEYGQPRAARATLEAWREQTPDDARSWRELGRAFSTIRLPQQAAVSYRAALAHDANYAEACAGLGSALQLQGSLTEACTWFERALELKPEIGWVYPALMAIRSHELAPERRAVLERLAADSAVAEVERMCMQFALGMWHDRRGDHADAFAHFQAGNRMHAQLEPFDLAQFDDRIERMLRLFDADFFAQRAEFGVHTEKPLFIVGMPRSGTSLVEQIIASHPHAHGAGELEDIGHMVRELRAIVGGERRYPEAVAALDKTQSVALAERYLGVLETRGGGALRVTDKMPFNMLWLGLIALLFPGARVVYCRRDAMDNCLSCYFQVFNAGLRFTYDLQHLGQVYRQHERLMAHWSECLPLNMLTVDYEAMVNDQEAQSRRLIEFAGLPWDERCLSFHTAKRAVHTASTWQVRQPMYQSSVARWRAYEPWLGELRDALGNRPDAGG